MPINLMSIIKAAGEVLPSVAQIAGSAAASRGAGKAAQAVTTQAQDKGALDRYAAEQATALRALEAVDAGRLSRAAGKMAEAELGLKAPGARASNAVRGDLLARGSKVTTGSHPRANIVDFGGGFNLGDLSPESRQLGQAMSREALLSQLEGSPTPYSNLPETDYASVMNRKAPGQTALPQDTAMDSILNAIGTYGGLASGILPAVVRDRRQTPNMVGAGGPATAPDPRLVGLAPPTLDLPARSYAGVVTNPPTAQRRL